MTKINFIIEAGECNGVMNAHITDSNETLSIVPSLKKGINNLEIVLDTPNTLKITLSGKTHRDTRIDPVTNNIIQDKYLKMIDVLIEGKPLDRNKVQQMFVIDTEKNGEIRTLTDNWKGKRFNSPNDLVMNINKKIIYFTDPRYVGDEERDIDFEVYLYLKIGISEDDIDLLSSLDGIIRKNDLEKDSNIDFSDNEEVSKLLKTQPKLLQRPILVLGDKAVIGRPPENILTLLHDA